MSNLSKYWAMLLSMMPVLVAVLPSVIVGLSNSPKTAGLAGYLKVVLQVFSVLTHKDEPGTFKLPGTVTLPPKA